MTTTDISRERVQAIRHGDERKYGALVTDDFRVHRSLYTDTAIFQDEMVRIFGGTWVYLLHESEIPEPFDFQTRRIGRRPVIVTRSENGEILVLLNRCSHRGTLLCTAECGSARRFQCAYHGWTYDNTGRLLAVTYPEGYRESFDKSAYNLGRVPRVESYRGFVFCSLNPDVESVTEWMGPARPVFDWATKSENGSSIKMIRASTMSFHRQLEAPERQQRRHVPRTVHSQVHSCDDTRAARSRQVTRSLQG